MNMIGVQGYTVRDYMADKAQFAETLTKLRKIGYTCIDHGIPQGMTASEFKQFLIDHDIKPLKVGSDVATLLKDKTQVIKDAHELGVDVVTILTIPLDMRGNEDGYKKFATDANQVAKDLKNEGLRTAYHHHAIEFQSFGGYNGMDIFINEAEDLDFILDTHWIAAAGVNPSDFIRRLKGRCPFIHFKDYGIDAPDVNKVEQVPRIYCEVGQGNLDWVSIAQACMDTGVNTVVVEQDICKVNPFTSLEISYKAIKNLGF